MGWREDRDEERFRRREYYYDAIYEAWRNGVNPDRVNYDRVEQDYYDGRDPDAEARRLQRMDHERLCQREQEEMEQAQREYYESLELNSEPKDDGKSKGGAA